MCKYSFIWSPDQNASQILFLHLKAAVSWLGAGLFAPRADFPAICADGVSICALDLHTQHFHTDSGIGDLSVSIMPFVEDVYIIHAIDPLGMVVTRYPVP